MWTEDITFLQPQPIIISSLIQTLLEGILIFCSIKRKYKRLIGHPLTFFRGMFCATRHNACKRGQFLWGQLVDSYFLFQLAGMFSSFKTLVHKPVSYRCTTDNPYIKMTTFSSFSICNTLTPNLFGSYFSFQLQLFSYSKKLFSVPMGRMDF